MQIAVTRIFATLSVGTEVPIVAPCVNSVYSYVNMHVYCVSLPAWTNHIFIYLGLVHWDDLEGWYGEGGGRGVQDGEHVYAHGGFMLMWGLNLCLLHCRQEACLSP